MIEDTLKFIGCIIAVIVGFVVVMIGIFSLITVFDRPMDRNACLNFGRTSGYEVQWADWSFWSYECLAKTESGKWIPTDQLREVNR